MQFIGLGPSFTGPRRAPAGPDDDFAQRLDLKPRRGTQQYCVTAQSALKVLKHDNRWNRLAPADLLRIQTTGDALNVLARSPNKLLPIKPLLIRAGIPSPSSRDCLLASNALRSFIEANPGIGFSENKTRGRGALFRYTPLPR
jgi:hypothetical protein